MKPRLRYATHCEPEEGPSARQACQGRTPTHLETVGDRPNPEADDSKEADALDDENESPDADNAGERARDEGCDEDDGLDSSGDVVDQRN